MTVPAGIRIALLCGALLVALRADAQTLVNTAGRDGAREAESEFGNSVRLRPPSGLQAWTVSRAIAELKTAAVSGVDAAIKPTRSIIDRLRASGAARSSSQLRAFFTTGKAGILSKERRNALPGYARYATNLAYIPAGGVGFEYRIAARISLRGDVTLLVDPEKNFAPRYGVSLVVPIGSR